MFEHRRATHNENFSIELFAPMLKNFNDRAVNAEIVKKGFMVTGWYPFDKNAVDYSLCLSKAAGPATVNPTDEVATAEPEDFLQLQIRLAEEKLVQLKKQALEITAVNGIWGEIAGIGTKIDTARQSSSPETHFPALQNVLEKPKPPKRKGTQSYLVNMPPVLTGSSARAIIVGMNEKADEISTLKQEKKSLEEQIKILRATVAAEKKRAPRRKKGEVVAETESEIDLRDLLHRKGLMQSRLKDLLKKPQRQDNNELVEHGSDQDAESESDAEVNEEPQAATFVNEPQRAHTQEASTSPAPRQAQRSPRGEIHMQQEVLTSSAPVHQKRSCNVVRDAQKKLCNK